MRLRAVTALVVAFPLVACGAAPTAPGVAAPGGAPAAPAAPPAASYPVTVQNCGREVTVEAAPQRVMVIGGEAGTLVHAAGGVDRVVAFAPLDGEPLGEAQADLAARPQVPITSGRDISRELILGQSPDLLVTFGLGDVPPEDLAAAGIPTLTVSGYCGGTGASQSERQGSPLEGVATDVEMLGRVLGTTSQADAAADNLRARVEAVRTRVGGPTGEQGAALFVTGPDEPLGAYGNLSTVHEQMEIVGLGNVFGQESERYFEPSVEALIGTAPDVVVGLHEAADLEAPAVRDAVLGRPELAQLPAVAAGRVVPLEFYYSGHGTLAVDGLERLADALGAAG